MKDFDYYLSLMRNNVSGFDVTEGSVVDGIFRAVAYALAAAQYDLQGFAEIAYPADGSGEYLDARAEDVGLTRKPGTKARASVTFTSAPSTATILNAGTKVQTADGLTFETLEGIIVNGSATVTVEAENIGSIYNVPAGAINTMQTASPVTVVGGAASGGSDPESDADLLARLQTYLQQAPASGNEAQYLDWALSVPGVGFARVVPRPSDAAYAVQVILVGSDMQPASAAVVSAVEAFLADVREVNIVTSAAAATAKTVNITATVTLADGASADDVAAQFRALVDDYFAELVKTGDDLIYVRVGAMLMSIDGVQNYSALQINSGTSDVTFSTSEVPVVGTITLTAS